jgi:hypothetical protein
MPNLQPASRLFLILSIILLFPMTAFCSPISALAQTPIGYVYSPGFEASGENYLDVPDEAKLRLEKFSVGAWFKTSANHYVNGMIVNKGGIARELPGENLNYGIWLTSQERLKAGFEGTDGTDYYVTHPNTYNDGNWHNVVLSYDGSKLRLYVDGTQLSWRSIRAIPDSIGTLPVRVGANSDSESGYFIGQLDEIRLWNRSITAAEISDQYQLGVFNATGIVAYLEMPDLLPPSIIAPPDRRTVSTGDLTPVSLGTPIVADHGDPFPAITNNSPPAGFPIGSSIVTWIATDRFGNSATANQTVRIIKNVTDPDTVHTFCSLGCNYDNLQTAIDSLPDSGGKVLIGAGTHVISSTVTLKSNTVIEFGSQAKIYFRGIAIPILDGNRVSNIKIVGGEIVAERHGVHAFSFNSSSGIAVDRTVVSLVKGVNSSAFYCRDCTGVYISNIDVSSASRLIDIVPASETRDGKSADIWIENSVFDNASIEGIKVNHSNDVHIINNTVSNTGDNGIDIGYDLNSDVADNQLIHTGFPNGGAIGTDSADWADVTSNYINATGKNGIQVYRASSINVGGNTIIDAGAQGIAIITQNQPTSNIKIVSNHIVSPAGVGIYESRGQSEVEIGNNIIEQMPPSIKAINIVRPNLTTRVYGNLAS